MQFDRQPVPKIKKIPIPTLFMIFEKIIRLQKGHVKQTFGGMAARAFMI
jgi:hypothetical protein